MSAPATRSVLAFQQTWRGTTLSERSAYQQHFLNLCELFGLPKPVEVDPTGQDYSFEKSVDKSTGRRSLADIWRRPVFMMEYIWLEGRVAMVMSRALEEMDLHSL